MSGRGNRGSANSHRSHRRGDPLSRHWRQTRENYRYNASQLLPGYQVAQPAPPPSSMPAQNSPRHSLVPQYFPSQLPYPPDEVQSHAPAPCVTPSSISHTGSGNTANSAVGGSYNRSTRTNHRVGTQIAATMNNSGVLHIQNLHFSPSRHQSPGPLPLSNNASPAIPSGENACPMDQPTTASETTSPERIVRVPDPVGEHLECVIRPIPMDQGELTPGEVATAGSSSMPRNGDGENITFTSESATLLVEPKTCNEVYASRLSPKRRGFALWIPEPNKNLPFPYQRKGIQIGDVGILRPSGSFSFIFNICVPRDDPINPRSLPEGFAPIHPPIDPIDIHTFADFQPNSYLASTSIEKFQDDTTSPGLFFRTSASEGAILTMPEGAISQDLENVPRFRKYAAANVQKWYKYINGPRGREAKNGDVRLVVGCDKATCWGMAALSNANQHSQLKFKPLDGQTSDSPSRGYTWEYSGVAEVRVGPDQEAIDNLRREDPDSDDSTTQNKYLNQCLFVRTLNVTLNDDDWDKLNREIDVGCTPDSTTGHGAGTSSPSPRNQNPSSDNVQSTTSTSNFGIQRTAGGSSPVESTLINGSANSFLFSSPPTATSCQPSRILNEALLKMVPTAKMVVTHDEDWYPCIQEDMTMSSDPEQILATVSNTKDIREDNGVIYLEPRVSREMKYFADLTQLTMELKKNSSNLEQYLYGTDPSRSARWNEMVFLLELCYNSLSPLASNSDHSALSRNSLPHIKRIKEIESLLGSLLIDGLFLDRPSTFEPIYAFRPRLQGAKPSSFDFRIFALTKLSSMLGREPTGTEHLNSIIQRKESPISGIGSGYSKDFFSISSDLYLLYLAFGEAADLKQMIEYFRQQKLPEWTSVRGSLSGPTTYPMNQLRSHMQEERKSSSQQRIQSHFRSSGPDKAGLSHVKNQKKKETIHRQHTTHDPWSEQGPTRDDDPDSAMYNVPRSLLGHQITWPQHNHPYSVPITCNREAPD